MPLAGLRDLIHGPIGSAWVVGWSRGLLAGIEATIRMQGLRLP